MVGLAIGMAVIVCFNLGVLFWKIYKRKYLDLGFDILILAGLSTVLGGSTLSLMIANIASFLMSIILYWIPMRQLFPFVGSTEEAVKGVVETVVPKGGLNKKRYC